MLARRVKNRRLVAVGYVWVFVAVSNSPGTRAHCGRRRERGERHNAAQRNLFERVLGMLHHCLQTRQFYDELHAFSNQQSKMGQLAARERSAC